MTISNTIRTAGPFIGNGITTAFPFTFKVFKKEEVLAVQTDVATGVATPLVLNSSYSVVLNSDQNASPGGTATLSSVLATGQTLVLTSDLSYLQPLDITNGGGFYPAVLNAAFDRLTIFCQQLFSLASRSLKLPLSDTGMNADLPSAAARANKLLGFDSAGRPIVAAPVSGSAAEVAISLANAIANYALSTGSSLIGWIQLGTGSIYRTVLNKLREIFSFQDFGAVGIGADETILLQTALSARGATGHGQSEIILPPGDFLIDSTPVSYALQMNADTHVRGTGGQIRAGAQDFRMLSSLNKGNVRVDSMRFVAATTPGGNDAMSAIYFGSDGPECANLIATYNDIVDTSWGLLASAESASGSINGLRLIGNHVRSTTLGTKSDGLHGAGRHYGTVMVGNTVRGRADAGFAMNMTGTASGYGFALVGNASLDNLVGIDCSGSQYGVVCGNVTYNTVNSAASNPGIRAITYSGSVPQYLLITGNLALRDVGATSDVDMKVTTGGADTHITISNNMLRTFFTDARFITITGNTFMGGAAVNIDNNAGEIFIGPNNFEAAFDLFGAGNPGLSGNVYVAKQNWTRQYHPNFLPNYSDANPFWALKWFFDADRAPVINSTNTTASNVPVDVPGGMVVLDRACILDGIVGLADLTTHTGHISLCDLSNNELARVDFPVVAGVGGTNIVCVLTGPTRAGNTYKIKLLPGTYKLRYWADVGSITLKKADLMLWS